MSNTKQAKAEPKADQNGSGDAAAAQDAQAAEANGTPRTFEFGGYTYEILEGQPSWTTMRHLATWATGNDIGLVRALLDCIGEDQFDLAGTRHGVDEMPEFFFALQKVLGGN